jgi:hypothetical protein
MSRSTLLVNLACRLSRRKERAESASSAVHQRQQVKDLLGDMHQLKDFRDIDKSKKFTRSILFEQEQQKSMTLKEYQFQHLKPIDDFVRPDDQLSPRMTGYEHGHIRSLLKLDVYGPAASVTIERERDSGVLPRSPNVDRHQVLNPHHTLAISRPGTSQSVASSRASTAGSTSYNGAFPSLKVLRKQHDHSLRKSGHRDHPDRSISPTFAASTDISHSLSNNNVLDQARANSRQGSRGRSSQGHNHHQHGHNDGGLSLNRNATDNYVMNPSGAQVDFAGPGLRPMTGSSVGTGTRTNSRPVSVAGHSTARSRSGKYPEQTFPGVAITEEERLLGGDPFLRRTTWYKQFATSKKVSIFVYVVRYLSCNRLVCVN